MRSASFEVFTRSTTPKKKCFSNTTFFIWCAAFGCTIFFASEENHLINQIVASMSETKFYMTALFRVNLSTRVIIYFINTCHCTEVIIQQFELFSARFWGNRRRTWKKLLTRINVNCIKHFCCGPSYFTVLFFLWCILLHFTIIFDWVQLSLEKNMYLKFSIWEYSV